mgnify:CR=1 FL=1
MSSNIRYMKDLAIDESQVACISIVGPDSDTKCDVAGICIRGVESSLEEAKIMAKELHRLNNSFNIYTVPLGKFIPLSIKGKVFKEEETNYANEEVEKLMRAVSEEKKRVDKNFVERIDKEMEEGRILNSIIKKKVDETGKYVPEDDQTPHQALEKLIKTYSEYDFLHKDIYRSFSETAINEALEDLKQFIEHTEANIPLRVIDDIKEYSKTYTKQHPNYATTTD